MKNEERKRKSYLAFVLTAIFSFFILSFSLVLAGPTQPAGTGSGAIAADGGGNVSLGTGTVYSENRLTIIATSTGTGVYSLRVLSASGGGTLFAVRGDGNVGIGTASPNYTLHVAGNIYSTGSLIGTVSANNVTAGVFPSGNFAFTSSLGIATTSQVGLPQTLSVYGGGYFSGNVGIGTADPSIGKLQVSRNTAGQAIYSVAGATSGTNYGIDAEATGAGAALNVGGYFAAAGGTTNYAINIPAGFPPAGASNYAIYSASPAQSYFAGNVGIGITAPGQKLSVAGTVESTSGGFKFPDGTTQTTAAVTGLGGGGTANYISKWTAGTTLGNSQIFDNGVNMGVGAANPAAKLHIKAADNSWGAGIRLEDDTTSNRFNIIYDDRLRIVYNESVYGIVMDVSGNVGIGTAAPGRKFEVVGLVNQDDIRVSASAHSGGIGVDSNATYWGVGIFQDGVKRLNVDSNGAVLIGSTYITGDGPSEGLAVQGNVGIGTAAPAYKLDILGNERVSGNLTVTGTITGSYSGTISATNVSAGQFGLNTGGGNYTFPAGGRIAFNGSSVGSGGGLYGVGNGNAYSNLNSIAVDTVESDGGVLELVYYGGTGVRIGGGTGNKWIAASQFIDGESTGYYADPAGTSNLNVVTVNGNLNFTSGGLRAHTGTYTSVDILGSTNGYSGLNFTDVTGGGGRLMVHNTADIQGFYNESGTWSWYFQGGVLSIGSVPWARLTSFPAACPAGQAAQAVGSSLTCVSVGTGDITGVTAGTGLSGGGVSGDVTVSVNTAVIQNRVSGTCAAGSSIRIVNLDGTVTCETDDNSGGTVTSIASGAGLTGGPITGLGTLSVNTTDISTCTGSGQKIIWSSVNSRFVCGTDNDSGGTGDITDVVAGSGLTGGGSTGAVTLNIGAGTNISVAADSISVVSNPTFSGDVILGDGGAGTDLTVGGGAGKINAGTIDPIYTIGGKKYATYLPAMTGVKEETTGVIRCKVIGDRCKTEINFSNLEEGSDLWLFGKVTDIKNHFEEITVLLTPAFDGRVWYKKNTANLILTFYVILSPNTYHLTPDAEISYRLTAPRFDTDKWPNISTDADEGFNLDKLIR